VDIVDVSHSITPMHLQMGSNIVTHVAMSLQNVLSLMTSKNSLGN